MVLKDAVFSKIDLDTSSWWI